MTKRSIKDMSPPEILYRLLKKENGFYEAIRELTDQENGLLKRGADLKAISSTGKKKKILLGCIDEIESALRPIIGSPS